MGKESALAKRLLEVIPPLMHRIRAEIRAVTKERLTVPQYRIMSNIQRGISRVGQIAEYQGVSQPAMSKMVDGLVRRGLVKRIAHESDRRQIVLELTSKGTGLFQEVKKLAQVRLADRLVGISEEDQRKVEEALSQIDAVFAKNSQTPGSRS